MMKRRDFLGCTAATLTTLISPALLAQTRSSGTRTLGLYNTHTGEQLRTSYWLDGQYLPQELKLINHILRDYRTDEQAVMDPQLLDLLHALQLRTGQSTDFEVISAYRSAASNDWLQKTGSGVAKRSLHMLGKAIDIRLPGIELTHLRQAALTLHAGGVGYYPESNFIHVDTGRPRFW